VRWVVFYLSDVIVQEFLCSFMQLMSSSSDITRSTFVQRLSWICMKAFHGHCWNVSCILSAWLELFDVTDFSFVNTSFIWSSTERLTISPVATCKNYRFHVFYFIEIFCFIPFCLSQLLLNRSKGRSSSLLVGNCRQLHLFHHSCFLWTTVRHWTLNWT